MAIEILGQTTWPVHWGGINRLGGVEGQLTRCRHNGVLFYVRENLQLDHFHLSSGERQGLKAGRLSRRHPQVLELLAPARLGAQLAELVRQTDSLDRPVRRNRYFTWAWAERQFAQADKNDPILGGTPMRVIEVTVSPTGEATIQTKGYAGGDCLQASKFLEQALGVIATDNKTTEFYAAPTTEQHVQQ